MDRKGVGITELMELALVIIVLYLGISYVTNGFGKSNSQIKQFSSCGGTFGTLGGKTGYCSASKNCNDAAAAAAGDGITDVYFQYIGTGFGCPDAKNSTKQYCCIGLDKAQNPLNHNVINVAACQSLDAGTWGYQILGQTGTCTKLSASSTLPINSPDTQIFFVYKPLQTDVNCVVYPDYNEANAITYGAVSQSNCFQQADQNGVVSIGPNTPVSYLDFSQQDRTLLNHNTQTIGIKLRSWAADQKVKEVLVTLQVSNAMPGGVRYCSAAPTASEPECSGNKVGDSCNIGSSKCKLMNDGIGCTCSPG